MAAPKPRPPPQVPPPALVLPHHHRAEDPDRTWLWSVAMSESSSATISSSSWSLSSNLITTHEGPTSGRGRLDSVRIGGEKRASVFLEVAQGLGVAPGNVVSIGNSLTSDILPAVEAGMRGVWIDAHVWEYERARTGATAVLPEGVVVATSILEVPAILDGHLEWH